MNWAKKRVLVTGAGGFIGSHLTEELLKKKAEVTAFLEYPQKSSNLDYLPTKDYNVLSGDLKMLSTVNDAMRDIDIVFHLASHVSIPYSYLHPSEVIFNNVIMATNIFDAARVLGTKVVFTSTSEVYGTAQCVPMNENHPLNPQSPYAASKLAADKIAESYHKSFDLPVIIVRPFNNYGPRQSARAVIPAIITQALKKKDIMLGSLEPTRDFLFVKDSIEGFIMAAESDKYGEVFNLGTNSEISIGDIANKIVKLCKGGKVVTDEKRKRPPKSEVLRLRCDNSKAQKMLGWRPKYGLEEGLRITIKWIRQNQSIYDPDTYNV